VLPQLTRITWWRCAMLVNKRREVGILGHDGHVCVSGRRKDRRVCCSLQVQVAHGHAVDSQRHPHPRREGGRQLIVEPDGHAATMG